MFVACAGYEGYGDGNSMCWPYIPRLKGRLSSFLVALFIILSYMFLTSCIYIYFLYKEFYVIFQKFEVEFIVAILVLTPWKWFLEWSLSVYLSACCMFRYQHPRRVDRFSSNLILWDIFNHISKRFVIFFVLIFLLIQNWAVGEKRKFWFFKLTLNVFDHILLKCSL